MNRPVTSRVRPRRGAGRSRRLVLRGLPTLLGWIMIVVALDWAVGAALGTGDDAPQQADTEVEGQIPLDPRADGAAMAAYPWRDAYFEELNSLSYDYSPYVLGRLGTNRGAYINTTPDGRRSYVPEAATGDGAVDIWFFGGSTMFGEGQRDEYTIPSEVARIAERHGLVVRPHNIAQQGLVAWQELLIFERELARRPAPDIVVFYDGTNDFNAQLEVPDDDPVHYDAGDFWGEVEQDGLPVPRNAALPEPTAWQSYLETSAASKLLRNTFGIDPAGAQDADGVSEVVEPETVLDETRDIYLRAVDLARFLAGEHDIVPFFFWQPVQLDPGTPYRELAEGLPDPVIDLSAVLDDPPAPVYIDGGHTNELGAELVAEAMYPHLEAAIEQEDGR